MNVTSAIFTTGRGGSTSTRPRDRGRRGQASAADHPQGYWVGGVAAGADGAAVRAGHHHRGIGARVTMRRGHVGMAFGSPGHHRARSRNASSGPDHPPGRRGEQPARRGSPVRVGPGPSRHPAHAAQPEGHAASDRSVAHRTSIRTERSLRRGEGSLMRHQDRMAHRRRSRTTGAVIEAAAPRQELRHASRAS